MKDNRKIDISLFSKATIFFVIISSFILIGGAATATSPCSQTGCRKDAASGSSYCYFHQDYPMENDYQGGYSRYSSTTRESAVTKESSSDSNNNTSYSNYNSYSSYDSGYDEGYDDVYEDDDYDSDRYDADDNYADGVDDAIEDFDDEMEDFDW